MAFIHGFSLAREGREEEHSSNPGDAFPLLRDARSRCLKGDVADLAAHPLPI
ncbi:MAG: hypothetical protein WDN28_09965 [Chthoniobacter sp.]